MRNVESWLQDMSAQAVPAGAAAGALAAAMGAALVAKAARSPWQRAQSAAATRASLEATRRLADTCRTELWNLAQADERAFAAVLATGGRPEARREAVDIPLRIAETSQTLPAALPGLIDSCRPALCPDLEIGGRLLQVGRDAARLVATTNLQNWRGELAGHSLWARLAELERKV